MIVVVIIALLTAISIPLYEHYRENAENGIVAHELQVYENAFRSHAVEQGFFPATQDSASTYPASMEAYLEPTGWNHPAAFGGRPAWKRDSSHNGTTYEAVIVLSDAQGTDPVAVRADAEQLQALDRSFDDGDLKDGKFQAGYRNQPVYVVDVHHTGADMYPPDFGESPPAGGDDGPGGDHDRGHGNDADGYDEDNPGNSSGVAGGNDDHLYGAGQDNGDSGGGPGNSGNPGNSGPERHSDDGDSEDHGDEHDDEAERDDERDDERDEEDEARRPFSRLREWLHNRERGWGRGRQR